MDNIIRMDRKQVFGTEEIDESYLLKIKRLFDERMRELTRQQNEVTMPLTKWVN